MPLPSFVQKIFTTFYEAGFAIYLIGGYVRSHLLGTKDSDFDFASNAHPDEIKKLFSPPVKIIPTGIKHGTLTLHYQNQNYEITTFRKDGDYLDYRHPEKVIFADDLFEDVERRDFTINALAYDFKNQVVIDYFSGLEDLKKKKLKAIGNPEERFLEDALRMMRACRFCARLNFTMEVKTKQAIEKNYKLIRNIAWERIRDELVKIICSNNPTLGIELLRQTNLLQEILPELHATFGVSQNKHHAFDVYHHTLEVVKNIENDKTLRLAALFHDIAKPVTKEAISEEEATFYKHEIVGSRMTKKILQRLRFSKKEILEVTHLVRHHMFHYQDVWLDKTVRRFIQKVGEKNIPDLFSLRRADRAGKGYGVPVEKNQDLTIFNNRIKTILAKKEALHIKDLKINGNEIMDSFKLSSSPLIGKILHYLLDAVLHKPELNQKKLLLNLVEKYLKNIN